MLINGRVVESGLGGVGGLNKVTEDALLTLGEVRTGPGRIKLLDEEYFEQCFDEKRGLRGQDDVILG